MSPPRILYDLSFAAAPMGFSGIPQDTRLLFHGLAQSDTVQVAGLIRPFGRSYHLRRNLARLDAQAVFLGHLNRNADLAGGFERWLRRRIGRWTSEAYRTVLRDWRGSGRLFAANPLLIDPIWRMFFSVTVPSDGYGAIADRPFFLSRIGLEAHHSASLGYRAAPRLRTEGFDFLLTQDAKFTCVPAGTRKIARYHDGIPVSGVDTFDNFSNTKLHVQNIRKTCPDTIYVCNSTSAASDVDAISEGRAKTAVIPYFIPQMKRVTADIKAIRQIAESRMSGATVAPERRADVLNAWFDAGGEERVDYVMSLATIEPRKNYVRLIEAWNLLRMRKRRLRLMIVGSPGWDFEKILNRMRPYVAEGRLLHLEKVAQTELPYLYSRASLFVFPSVVEGFGLPPTEAMQCGVPVVASDIPAHRYMGGDAPLFCDPYDVRDIAAKMKAALDEETDLRETLIEKGHANVKRFTHEALLPEWEAFFKDNMPRRSRA